MGAPAYAMVLIWVLWLASWIVAALWADPVVSRPNRGDEFLYRATTLGGAVLLGVGDRLFPSGALWPFSQPAAWGLVAIIALGLAFTWWARLYLGPLWSSSVTKKSDHRVVDSGPYAIVRHPIYTGLIAAIFATAILKGDIAGFIGAVIMTLGFWLKARLEERFLREQLGAAAYDAYRRKVPMLLPFGPRSS
jgi:protein-S-isoprenylcysteine O-methyltransferase Ste14